MGINQRLADVANYLYLLECVSVMMSWTLPLPKLLHYYNTLSSSFQRSVMPLVMRYAQILATLHADLPNVFRVYRNSREDQGKLCSVRSPPFAVLGQRDCLRPVERLSVQSAAEIPIGQTDLDLNPQHPP